MSIKKIFKSIEKVILLPFYLVATVFNKVTMPLLDIIGKISLHMLYEHKVNDLKQKSKYDEEYNLLIHKKIKELSENGPNFIYTESDLNGIDYSQRDNLKKLLDKTIIEDIEDRSRYSNNGSKILEGYKNLLNNKSSKIRNIINFVINDSRKFIFLDTEILSNRCLGWSGLKEDVFATHNRHLESTIIHEFTHAACRIKFNNDILVLYQNNIEESKSFDKLSRFQKQLKFSLASPYSFEDHKSRSEFKQACIDDKLIKRSTYFQTFVTKPFGKILGKILEPFKSMKLIIELYIEKIFDVIFSKKPHNIPKNKLLGIEDKLLENRSNPKSRENAKCIDEMFDLFYYRKSNHHNEIIARIPEIISLQGKEGLKQHYPHLYGYYKKAFAKESNSSTRAG